MCSQKLAQQPQAIKEGRKQSVPTMSLLNLKDVIPGANGFLNLLLVLGMWSIERCLFCNTYKTYLCNFFSISCLYLKNILNIISKSNLVWREKDSEKNTNRLQKVYYSKEIVIIERCYPWTSTQSNINDQKNNILLHYITILA